MTIDFYPKGGERVTQTALATARTRAFQLVELEAGDSSLRLYVVPEALGTIRDLATTLLAAVDAVEANAAVQAGQAVAA
jgi:hypothetical protein